LTDTHRNRTIVLQQRSLRAALRTLAKRGVRSVLVEGGGHTLGTLFKEGLANEAVFYVAPLLVGGSVATVAGADDIRRVEKSGSGVPMLKTPRAPEGLRLTIRLQGTTYARVGSCIRMEGKVAAEKAR
jgi:diaminohydroxyphosphoribosylaminopyrimidine deaminase/5-amino-6-(5-phosphoribosylamino)uracil reductase